MLDRYIELTLEYDCIPTFPITAVTLKRHPDLISKLSKYGIEFALHGYIHTDYKSLSLVEQNRHFGKAVETFKACHVPFTGFRAPYLRVSNETPKALDNLGILYDSSHVIHWDVIDKSKSSTRGCEAYDRLLDFYQPRSAQEFLALPRFINGFIEIPVSVPDDEAMVDRLGITDKKVIAEIWMAILERTYDRGELFTVQLHHERIPYCESALTAVLQQARKFNPPVWIATLGEIAKWWKEREGFTLQIDTVGKGRYRVKANCSTRATLLLKNCKVNQPAVEWSNYYQSIAARDFVVESPTSPVIGVGLDSSREAVSFLTREGFVVERSDQPDNYGIYLSDLAHFQETDEKPLIEKIELSLAPLLRYWRWPDQNKSALAITGDIDSITLIDFTLRVFENWWQNGRRR
ncbi:MAG: polysaccharide deacetylase family protein [Candidatus Thorarchaeota archaeon]|jgi:peptidoglycan/xylan/chitin deacetylase (PgdA/CDA1 family)